MSRRVDDHLPDESGSHSIVSALRELRVSATSCIDEAVRAIDDPDALSDFLLATWPDADAALPGHRSQLARLAGRYAAAAAARPSAECDHSPDVESRLRVALVRTERGVQRDLDEIRDGYVRWSDCDALEMSHPSRVVDGPSLAGMLLLCARRLAASAMMPPIDAEAVLFAHAPLAVAMRRVLAHIAEEQEDPDPWLYERPGRTAARAVAMFADAATGLEFTSDNRLVLTAAAVPLWLHCRVNDVDVRVAADRAITSAATAWVGAREGVAVTGDRRRELLLHLVIALADVAGESWDHARCLEKHPDLLAYAESELWPLAVEALLQLAISTGLLAQRAPGSRNEV